MIYLFAGDNEDKKLSAYESFLSSLPGNIEIFSFSRDNFNQMQIESLYSGAGLFFDQSAAIFSGILEREDTASFILEKLPLMGESENYFIFLEGKLSKPVIDQFKKARAEVNVFEQVKEKKEQFNSFILANALRERDRFNLWAYFRQAIEAEVALEALTGVLFWQAKDMILRKNFRKFSESELKDFAAKISYLLPEARSGGRDAEAAFEQFILEKV